MSNEQLAQALRRIKSNLMHTRRFGVDDIGTWRRAATQAEGDIEEAIAAHEAALAAVPVEPVAWMMPWTGHSPSLTTDPSDYPQERDAGLLIPLYAHPAPQPQQALQTRLDDYATEINRLRNVIQAACIGGTDYMIERWKQLFPDAPVPTVKPQQAAPEREAVVDDLRDRLVAISAAVADQDDRAAQSMLREALVILAATPPQPQQADYSQISPEQAAEILAAVDLVELPPIRVRKAAADFLLDRSNASGRVVQAEVREILESAATTPPQPTAPATQAQAVSQWQGIESAPKDGKDLLIHTKDGLTRLAFFDRARGGVWSCWPGRENMQATHWMPLPEAPESAAQKESTC